MASANAYPTSFAMHSSTRLKGESRPGALKACAARTPQHQTLGSGPLLIYIPGLDGTGELFFKQAPALSRSFRVVTYRSRDGQAFTYDDLTGDVARIIRDLGEAKASLLGESFGGTVALSFALRYPAMVERLIVVNSFARFRGRMRIKLAGMLAGALPFRALRPARLAASLLGLYVDGVSRDDRRRFFQAIRSVNGESYARRLTLIAELDLERRLPEIRTPTLFISGEADLLIPSAREARSMASRMPNAYVKVIPRAGHACLMGDRVRLADILTEWTGQ
ncbi:MAG: alpha/beta hydrolase [Blastocatellia bacterium]